MSGPSDKVVILDNDTTLDLDPDRVIVGAIEAGLTEVIVAGYDRDGNEYFAASTASSPRIVWLMERFKAMLLKQPDMTRRPTSSHGPSGEIIPFKND